MFVNENPLEKKRPVMDVFSRITELVLLDDPSMVVLAVSFKHLFYSNIIFAICRHKNIKICISVGEFFLIEDSGIKTAIYARPI